MTLQITLCSKLTNCRIRTKDHKFEIKCQMDGNLWYLFTYKQVNSLFLLVIMGSNYIPIKVKKKEIQGGVSCQNMNALRVLGQSLQFDFGAAKYANYK